MNTRKRVWEVIEVGQTGDALSKSVDVFILSLIVLNVFAVVIGSVNSIYEVYGPILDSFEVFSVVCFSIEYIARLWACKADSRYAAPVIGRFKFAIHPMSMFDLAAVLPFFLSFVGADLRVLRVLRLLRFVRLAKIGRYYSSLNMIKNVFSRKKEELILTSALMVMLLLVSSSILFYCENAGQPKDFSSIPATMWWAVTTLTTVGYGDLYPATDLGKFFAGVIAILGIGMFALPTGILGAGFVEEIQMAKGQGETCPHCGKEVH